MLLGQWAQKKKGSGKLKKLSTAGELQVPCGMFLVLHQ
jgi:hypothetical protein